MYVTSPKQMKQEHFPGSFVIVVKNCAVKDQTMCGKCIDSLK